MCQVEHMYSVYIICLCYQSGTTLLFSVGTFSMCTTCQDWLVDFGLTTWLVQHGAIMGHQHYSLWPCHLYNRVPGILKRQCHPHAAWHHGAVKLSQGRQEPGGTHSEAFLHFFFKRQLIFRNMFCQTATAVC